MSFPFEPQQGLIIVRAELWGPSGSAVLRLALDMGATGTVVNVGMLVAVGYDPALVPDRIQVTTGRGIEFVPRVSWTRSWPWDTSAQAFRCLATPYRPVQGLTVFLGWTSFPGRV
jgi:hypothetical protein